MQHRLVECASFVDEAQCRQRGEQPGSCDPVEQQQRVSLGTAEHFLSLQLLLEKYKNNNSQQIQPNTMALCA